MIWFLAIALILVTGLALRAGLVAFAGYVLLGVYLLSRWLTARWVHDLEVERECDSRPREIGETAEVVLTLTNRGSLPVLWVLVEDLMPVEFVRPRSPRVSVRGKRLRVVSLGAHGVRRLTYTVRFLMRGYYPLGPTVLETGDVFGLHRRHRVTGKPTFVLVYPRVIPLARYDLASRRPVGEVRLQDRLFEDPTRTAGVREYRVGDPLQRVHWKATARTGTLHCRVYEPTSLAGITLLLDFHADGYPDRGEPHRSELAVTTAASLAYAVSVLNQPVGLASNGRDAADRIREEAFRGSVPHAGVFLTRDTARESFELRDSSDRLRPVVIETRREFDQFQRVREALARLELSDGLTFARLVAETTPRLPRDATVIAILPRVPVESAVALGTLRRHGFAVTAILIGLDETDRLVGQGRLLAEAVRDIRTVNSEDELARLGGEAAAPTAARYEIDVPLV